MTVLSSELANENGALSSQPAKPAGNTQAPPTQKFTATRNGKIARLPREIRDELNRRLADGQQAKRLVRWLNSLPEVKDVLDADFQGQPINEMNLSNWKQGGFLEWQDLQEKRVSLARLAEETGTVLGSELNLPDKLSGLLMADFALTAHSLLASAPDPETRWQRLRELLPAAARITNMDLRSKSYELSRRRADRVEAQAHSGVDGAMLMKYLLESGSLASTIKSPWAQPMSPAESATSIIKQMDDIIKSPPNKAKSSQNGAKIEAKHGQDKGH